MTRVTLFTRVLNILFCVVYLPSVVCDEDLPMDRPHRHSHGVMDEKSKQVFDDLAIKLSSVSSAPQLYNVMARYNKQYCDKSIIRELEISSKTRADKEALKSMKSYCNIMTNRRLRRREVLGHNKLVNETRQVRQLFERYAKSKASCQPRKTVVEFHPPPGSFYIPRCTQVKRCSGCCRYQNEICRPRPQTTRKVKRKVVVVKVNEVMKIQDLYLEEHRGCECACNISAKQCTSRQVFEEDSCTCKCAHENHSCVSPRRWDRDTCKCECPNRSSCSTGYTRDHMCKCTRRNFNNLTTDGKKKREHVLGKPK